MRWTSQGYRDSNPNIQSQSLLCYRYTIPLSVLLGFCLYRVSLTDVIISDHDAFVNSFSKLFSEIFRLFESYFAGSGVTFPVLHTGGRV